MKDKISNDLSYTKAGYQSDKWKWVLNLPQNSLPPKAVQNCLSAVTKEEVVTVDLVEGEQTAGPSANKHDESMPAETKFVSRNFFTADEITREHIWKVYGLDKIPKNLPCQKKCATNPWCLAELLNGPGKEKARPTDQPRVAEQPVGLQNTANTCWINSALQALFQLPKFRNVINSVEGFSGEESMSSMLYLLQAMFVEMDTHANKAIACSPDSVFEKLAFFATREIMGTDADHEVLKCVSEFLENTIDTLIADPRLGPDLSPLFNISLMRIARWRCPSCETEHENQLAPATSYTVAAYVSAEECPLDQCLVDLQSCTQTGVSLTCGSDSHGQGGCGAQVKVDRIVTPKIQTLPTILVIRNNSLMDRELKRRLHVVYPETLDLTSHTLGREPATYALSAVIFHHGRWVKHFSAHVKTINKKWFNFNDEQVSEVTSRSASGIPPENHRNYFSAANVAAKYKHRPALRVSRGAFIWIYVRTNLNDTAVSITPPDDAVLEYVLQKQQKNTSLNHQLRSKMKKERKQLLEQLVIQDFTEDFCLIPEPVLSSWYHCDEIEYTPQPSLLACGLCEHKLFSPRKVHLLKCIKTEFAKKILTEQCGIHVGDSLTKLNLPVLMPLDKGSCKECVLKAVNHILFIERVKALHKEAKKEARKIHEGPTKVIGSETLEFWPRLAISAYVKENGLDTEEEEPESSSDSSKVKTEDEEKEDGSEVGKSRHLNGNHCSEETETASTSNCDKILVPQDNNVNGCDNQIGRSSDGICDRLVDKECSRTYVVDQKEPTKENVDDSDSSRESKDFNKENEINEDSNKENKENQDAKDVDSSKLKDKDTAKVLHLFNEELVCHHNLQSPGSSVQNISTSLASEIMDLCKEAIHPALYMDDFGICPECSAELEVSKEACRSGLQQKKDLSNLFREVKRPHPTRDIGKKVYLLSRDFMYDWKSYIRTCERGEFQSTSHSLTSIDNKSLLCPHDSLLFPVYNLQPHELTEHLVLLYEEEWNILQTLYPPNHTIHGHFEVGEILITDPGVCDQGCVENRAMQDYEEQFTYECDVIHIRQVNSANDIPRRTVPMRNSSSAALSSADNDNLGPRKKPRLAAKGSGDKGGMTNHRLVRASKYFASTDTIREVQNFIAERTGIWPMLQTLWLNGEGQVDLPGFNIKEGEETVPTRLNDDHRAMTLNSLRVRPGDTIYFRAAVEDMELAAGDGVSEFNEMDYD